MGELLVVLRGRRGHDQPAVDELVMARVVWEAIEVVERPGHGTGGRATGADLLQLAGHGRP